MVKFYGKILNFKKKTVKLYDENYICDYIGGILEVTCLIQFYEACYLGKIGPTGAKLPGSAAKYPQSYADLSNKPKKNTHKIRLFALISALKHENLKKLFFLQKNLFFLVIVLDPDFIKNSQFS